MLAVKVGQCIGISKKIIVLTLKVEPPNEAGTPFPTGDMGCSSLGPASNEKQKNHTQSPHSNIQQAQPHYSNTVILNSATVCLSCVHEEMQRNINAALYKQKKHIDIKQNCRKLSKLFKIISDYILAQFA